MFGSIKLALPSDPVYAWCFGVFACVLCSLIRTFDALKRTPLPVDESTNPPHDAPIDQTDSLRLAETERE